jgi:hypothetical protein
MKLGEVLVEKGVLARTDLDLALERQLIFGGHLGTSLIEMGLVDEETLGQALSKATGVPYAPRHLLANVDPETIKAVSKKIAQEYQVVPIKLESRSIHLAFVNPKDLRALDALRFATGRSVVAWIAPEIRVFRALETYYGVERRGRYIKLDPRLDEPVKAPPTAADGGEAPPTGDAVMQATAAEQDAMLGFGRPWQELADELFGLEPTAPKPPNSIMSLPELAERYCRAESRDDLARAVLEFAAGRVERMLLLFVRGNEASVWDERGFSLRGEVRRELTFDVTAEALFKPLMGSDHYHGPLPAGEDVRSFYVRLGVAAPSTVLLIPVHVNDHLVTAIVADGGPKDNVKGEVDDVLKAFRLFSVAVLMVALRKNLRDVARPVTRMAEY